MRKTIWGFALLVVVVLLASCSKSSEYTNVIPKDAAIVASFDFKEMAQKSGINGKEGEAVVTKLTDALKSGLEGEAYTTAEKIVKNPAETGLSFTDKVYLFVTPNSDAYALVAKVASESKVESLMRSLEDQQLCSDLKSESGCTWTNLGNGLCAYNGDTFLLVGTLDRNPEDMKGTLLAWMRQDATNSFASTQDFTKLSSAKGDINMVVNMSVLPREATMQMRMGMSADLKLEDIKCLVSTRFEKGKIVIDYESLIENKELIALYEKQTETSTLLKGKYMEYFPANTLLWASGNFNGEAIYNLLCENPTIKQSLENPMLPIDLKTIFSSIHGDIAVGYSSLVNNDLLVYADVTNKEFLKTFEDLRPLLAMSGGQMKLNSTGPDQYEFRMYNQSIWFGVKDNMFYLSDNEQMADEAGRRYGVSLQNTPWAGEVTRNRSFIAFNTVELLKEINATPSLSRMMGQEIAMVMKNVLGPCEYIDAMAPDWKGGQMNIVMKDKDTNVLQFIVRALENL